MRFNNGELTQQDLAKLVEVSRQTIISIEKGKFNPDAIALYKLNLKAGDLEYQPENLLLQLDRFSFLEKSGFQLRNLSFDASLKNTSASLSRFRARTNSSFVNGAVALKYLSLEKIINAPEIGSIDLQIPDLELAVQDAFFFQPDLKANEYLNKLVQHPFKGNISANGTLDSVQIETMQLKWGENTSLSGEGRLSDVTQSDSLSFDFDTVRALSIREDILEFVSEKEMGISIPQTVLVDAKLDGNLNNMNADAQLKIPEGKVQLTGNYQNQDRMQFDGNLKVDSLRLDKLLDNEQLGGLSFTMDVSGGGKNLNTLNAEIVSDFSQLNFQDYDFSNLELRGQLINGKGNIDLNFKDENLNFTTNTAVELDSIASKIGLDLNLIGADLYALGITDEKIKTGLQLKADFTGNASDYNLNAYINNGIAVYDNQQYQMGDIDLTTKIDAISTDVAIDSDFLVGVFKSNASPKYIESALTQCDGRAGGY